MHPVRTYCTMNLLKKSFAAIIILSALFLAYACEKTEYQSFEELDDANIQAYISQHNLSVERYKETDLYYEVLVPGTGREISYREAYPVIFTQRSLDGTYVSNDTLSYNNQYVDFFGYYPFGSSAAGTADSPVERTEDLKEVVKEVLKYTNGTIRIIVPSRLLYGRNGRPALGIPPNASMDYVITVHDNFEDYENEWAIPAMIQRSGIPADDFTKTEDGIYYKILAQGTGDGITVDSTVTVTFTLKRPDGSVISTLDSYSSLLSDNITAWQKIIPLVNKGGKVRFILPSSEGYGQGGSYDSNGVLVIPPYSPLDYEIEVKDE